jgi:hypothetical protein
MGKSPEAGGKLMPVVFTLKKPAFLSGYSPCTGRVATNKFIQSEIAGVPHASPAQSLHF